LLADIRFGRAGNSRAHVLDGWSGPEDGFTWSLGPRSSLNVGLPASAGTEGHFALELQLTPFIVPDRVPGQRLVLRVNGIPVSEEHLRSACTVLYAIPPKCLALPPVGGVKRLLVQLLHPDFARPCDYDMNEDQRELALMLRRLRVFRRPRRPVVDITVLPPLQLPKHPRQLDQWLRAVTGLDEAALLACFEQIQESHEAGLPFALAGPDLAGLPRPKPLCFDDLRAVSSWRFGEGQADDGTLRAQDQACIGRLQTGPRIYVVHRMGIISLSEARAFHLLLQDVRPNALLYLDEDPALPSGAVERVEHGVFHGKLDVAQFSSTPGAWTAICANTFRLWSAE
jgi:hypothetical protein